MVELHHVKVLEQDKQEVLVVEVENLLLLEEQVTHLLQVHPKVIQVEMHLMEKVVVVVELVLQAEMEIAIVLEMVVLEQQMILQEVR